MNVWPHISVRPLSSATSISSSASPLDAARGFSTKVCLPAWRVRDARSKCVKTGVAIITASTSGSAFTPPLPTTGPLPRSRGFNPPDSGLAGCGDAVDLRGGEMLEHRQRDLLRSPGHRDRTALGLPGIEWRLAVAGGCVVDAGLDARFIEGPSQGIALARADGEEVVDGWALVAFGKQLERRRAEGVA